MAKTRRAPDLDWSLLPGLEEDDRPAVQACLQKVFDENFKVSKDGKKFVRCKVKRRAKAWTAAFTKKLQDLGEGAEEENFLTNNWAYCT